MQDLTPFPRRLTPFPRRCNVPYSRCLLNVNWPPQISGSTTMYCPNCLRLP
jgi:hypothetical protein